ncbi:MAG: bifunctional oligoribonuclease/PAP phosphatase NrnA [Solirubrobacterales bacterium]|nr:bifunctional oligoribonuclease/PAP phosphatase NrnA [Solirubrobacterales bacterium]
MTENGHRSSRDAVLAELRAAERTIVITHENPDGDALGSLIAMQEILTALGKDSLMFIYRGEFPLPPEYRFLDLPGLVSEPPADLGERTIVFLDCGNLERNPAEAFQRPGAHILNIDHHHDNTRFGTVNLVDEDASCTAELVWEVMHGLGVSPSLTIANALYIGLVTDTGRFMYKNTGARAHLMAAELIDSGVDVAGIYRQLYEGIPYGKLALLARALTNIVRYDDGLITLSELTGGDFAELDAEESYFEGIIDHLRALKGTAVAGLVRERIGLGDGETLRKVSLRSADDRVDVSLIARAQGGGGHRQAAGFTTAMDGDQIVEFLRDEVAQQLATV